MIFNPSTIIRLLVLAFLGFANAALATELPLPNQPHLIVEGVGEVEQVPDIVMLKLEVSATAENFAKAKQHVDAIIGKALSAAKKHGVKAHDINASKISAAPQYDWHNQQRIYKGERITRQLEVTTSKVDTYNELVEGLLEAGISRLQNVELEFSNKKELQAQALKLAIDNAQQQAKTITGYLNIKAMKIFQVAPLSAEDNIRPMAMAAMDSQREAAPLKLAKQKIQQRVRIVYLLPQ